MAASSDLILAGFQAATAFSSVVRKIFAFQFALSRLWRQDLL